MFFRQAEKIMQIAMNEILITQPEMDELFFMIG